MINKKSFSDKVYELVRKVPRGKITTYGMVAKTLHTKAYQAIGQILKRNPDPKTVPCYKVIRSNGEIGGYSGNNPREIQKKINLLKRDGIKIKNKKIDLNQYEHRF